MKNRLIYLLCIVAGLLQSCVQDVDDLFDASAQERINQAIKDYKTLLCSAENGWRMEYYPSSIQEYGGYAMTLAFNENSQATIASEITGSPTKTVSSLYSIKADMGPTLNFDSYNEILHYFSDPDNTGGGGRGKGYEGDYEFIFQSSSQDTIVLKGKKTKNLIRLIRLSESSADYLSSIIEIDREMSELKGVIGFSGTFDGKELTMIYENSRRFTLTYDGQSADAPFMYTPSGIQFYKPIEIKGKTFQNLTWNSENESMVTEEGIQLIAEYDPDYPDYMQYVGEYTMTYTGVSGRKSIQIELVPKSYKQNYTIEGMLPIDLVMTYDAENKTMKLLNQQLSVKGYYLSVWEVSPGNLTYGGADFVRGMVAQLREGTTNIYDLVDYGSWEYIVRGMILWGASGEYKGFSESRFYDITLTKNE